MANPTTRPQPRIAALAALLAALGCGGGGGRSSLTDYAGDARFPQDYWSTAAPEDVGLSSRALEESAPSTMGIDSLLVVRHGKLVYERYGVGYHPYATHIQWCTTKSFLSALTGIAIDEGYLSGVDDPVLPHFSDVDIHDRSALKQRLTIEDLLTMRSGRRPMNDDLALPTPIEMGVNSLQDAMSTLPGTTYWYNDGDPAILASLLYRVLGRTPQAYAEEKLFRPLGISDWQWDTDGAGIGIPYRLHLRPRDMAKFGQLYLQRGLWNGAQLVPAGWVDRSTETIVPDAEGDGWGYGYLWWIDPVGGHDALGMEGQRIIVVPSKDMVIVLTASLGDLTPLNELEARIVSAAD
jgi:CubicO group peptidase (beta-lactamase class C family)